MEIINAIQKMWLSEEESMDNNILRLRAEFRENLQKQEILNNNIHSIVSDHANASRLINEIYEFMDYIGVSRDKLPFEVEEIDNDEIENIKNQEERIWEEDQLTIEKIEMYKLYLELIRNQRAGGAGIAELRKKTGRYITDFELFIDIFQLNCKAISLVRNSRSRCNDYEYGAYTDALRIFSIDNMKSLGHPSDDEAWKDGKAELVLAICRVSWELQYLTKLADRVGHYTILKDRRRLQQLKKSEKNNSVIYAWNSDTYAIEHSVQKDNVFYKTYKRILSDSKKNDIDYFISQI